MEWTPEQTMQMRKLHKQGLTTPEIADQMVLPVEIVRTKLLTMVAKENTPSEPKAPTFATKQKILQKAAPKTDWTDERVNQLVELYQSGKGVPFIAGALKLDYKTVYAKVSYLKKTGKLVDKLVAEVVPAPEPAPVPFFPLIPVTTIRIPAYLLHVAESRLKSLDKRVAAITAERDELAVFISLVKENEPAPAATDTSSEPNNSPKV